MKLESRLSRLECKRRARPADFGKAQCPGLQPYELPDFMQALKDSGLAPETYGFTAWPTSNNVDDWTDEQLMQWLMLLDRAGMMNWNEWPEPERTELRAILNEARAVRYEHD